MYRKQTGFTLIEILIASAILIVIGTITLITLNTSLKGFTIVNSHDKKITVMQMAMTQWQRDIQQIINLPIKDLKGQSHEALLYHLYPQHYLEFSRGGAATTLNGYERVAYYLQDSHLIRQAWQINSDNTLTTSTRQTILNNVSRWDITLIDEHNKILPSWPNYRSYTALPKAIILKYCLNNAGCVERFIALNGNAQYVLN